MATLSVDLQALEEMTFIESDSVEFPPPDIIAYNELRSCADLFRMYSEGILDIRPGFQREIVWTNPAQTRFIDSLVKQLPIPSMCFSLDYKTQKWQIIDGLQRMWSIIRFLRGDDWRLSHLDDVDPLLSGQYVSTFLEAKSTLRQYFLRIQNLTLPITVIRCDYSKPSHTDYLFTIFHRLNTGGLKLNNQEIRNCIFSGSFNNFIRELDSNEIWLKVNRRSSAEGNRYRGQEQILRFFAFHDEFHEYGGGLAAFLNRYMMQHREPGNDYLEEKRQLFVRTISIVYEAIINGYDERMGISVMEATFVGVSSDLSTLEGLPKESIRQMYDDLLASEEFSDIRLREGLSARQRVLGRLSTAVRIFTGSSDG